MKMPFAIIKTRQSGAVLITGLIFMVVLTIIVISALRSATLEERMAANARNRQVALQAAEAALRVAEASILGDAATGVASAAAFEPFTPSSFTTDCADGLCNVAVAGSEPRWKTIDWEDDDVTLTITTSALAGVKEQPKYIVEIAAFPAPHPPTQKCNPVLYRVTARGVGMDNSVAFVQAMYRHRPVDCP
jgi:type IV pilus assembly protein PilX